MPCYDASMRIPEREFEFTYARSSGPGGQNVNKVNSKAILRWNPSRSPSLSSIQIERLIRNIGHRLSSEGDLLIKSDRFRDQGRNREDCLVKFKEILAEALHVPKTRRKTKPSRSSRKKAKEGKAKHSEKKRLRSKNW